MNSFIKKIKERNSELKLPKFKKGDFIECKAVNTIAKVEDINYYGTDFKTGLAAPCYILTYIKNVKRLEALKERGLSVEFMHKRSKVIQRIDATYELIESEAARILYDLTLEGQDNAKSKVSNKKERVY
jgi:hypothetical protein